MKPDAIEALAERRVETLLLARNFSAAGVRCPELRPALSRGDRDARPTAQTVTPVEDLR